MSDNRCPECGYGQQTSHGDGQVECRRCGHLWQRSDSRYTPTEAEAEGMRQGILAQRRMAGLTGPHPYGVLDLTDPVDRRIVGSVYASMVPR